MARSIKYSQFYQPVEDDMNKILVVEDDRVYLSLLSRMLGGKFKVKAVATMADALMELGNNGFRAVVLDIGLPDSRQEDSVKRMKTAYPNCAIVVLSGNEHPDRIRQCILDSASSYLVKGRDDKDGEKMTAAIYTAIENNVTFQKLDRAKQEIENDTEI